MTTAHGRAAALAIILAVAGLARLAAADTLVTTGGGQWEGTVTETDDSYVLVTESGSTMTFPKSMVAKVVKDASTDDAAADAGSDAASDASDEAAAKDEADAPGMTPYVVIPIKGELGVDVIADGAAYALDKAAGRRALEHVVFAIDSPGGDAAEAEKVVTAMISHRDRFRYHALVRSANGPAVWIAMASHAIYMAPGSSLGGSAAAQHDSADEQRAAEAAAARLAFACSKLGRDKVLLDAFVRGEARVWAWRDAGGALKTSDEPPAGVPAENVVLRETGPEVLMLDRDQAAQLGLARPVDSADPAALGGPLELTSWKQVMRETEAAMERARRKHRIDVEKAEREAAERERRKALVAARIPATAEYINTNVREAQAADPSHFYYPYDLDTHQYSYATYQSHRQQCLKALGLWQNVRKGVTALAELVREEKELGMPPIEHGVDLPGELARANRQIERLDKEKDMRGP